MVKNMELTGVHSDRYSTAIHLLVNPDHIDLNSISQDITKMSQAPDLKLSDKGKAERASFCAAGGNHRRKAVAIVEANLKEKMRKMEEEIEILEKKKRKKSTTEKLSRLREELMVLRAKKAGMGKWTVILYDESK